MQHATTYNTGTHKVDPSGLTRAACARKPIPVHRQSALPLIASAKMTPTLGLCTWCACLLLLGACSATAPAPRTPLSGHGISELASLDIDVRIDAGLGLATTVVHFVVANTDNCTTRTSYPLVLPLEARLVDLSLTLSNGCTMRSDVKTEADARADFDRAVAKGRATAKATSAKISYDTQVLAIDVALPPAGHTTVRVEIRQLLQRRNGVVDFLVPLHVGTAAARDTTASVAVTTPPEVSLAAFTVPALNVTGLTANVTNGATRVGSASKGGTTATATAVFTVQHRVATGGEGAVPQTLRCSYDVTAAGGQALLQLDEGGYASYQFTPARPTGALAVPFLPRDVVFVIDVSGSMSSFNRLENAKRAFARLVRLLKAWDWFTINTFSNEGVEETFAPSVATEQSLAAAVAFVGTLRTKGGTNLHGGFVQGLKTLATLRGVRSAATPQGMLDHPHHHVSLLVVLTDGQASTGLTSPQQIASDVKKENEEVGAKIFCLSMGKGADLWLLMAVALENGGVAFPVYEGFGDDAVVAQIEALIQGEMGDLVLADVSVSITATSRTATVKAQPIERIGVLSHGSAISLFVPPLLVGKRVRARRAGEGPADNNTTPDAVSITTTRARATAPTTTTPKAEGTLIVSLKGTGIGGTFAQTARLDLGAAPSLLGNLAAHGYTLAAIKRLHDQARAWARIDSKSSSPGTGVGLEGTERAAVALAEATALAIKHGIVWEGLTAMVIVQDDTCSTAAATAAQQCTRKESGATESPKETDEDAMASAPNMAKKAPASFTPNSPMLSKFATAGQQDDDDYGGTQRAGASGGSVDAYNVASASDSGSSSGGSSTVAIGVGVAVAVLFLAAVAGGVYAYFASRGSRCQAGAGVVTGAAAGFTPTTCLATTPQQQHHADPQGRNGSGSGTADSSV